MMNMLKLFDRKDNTIHIGGIIWRLFIIPLIFGISLNLGKALAYILWNLIVWLEILPYLEKFFSWFVWI